MKKKLVFTIVTICGISSLITYSENLRGGKINKPGEAAEETIDTSNMQKDFEELMKSYKELKVKAQEFQKKYRMLPPELMPLMMKQGGPMMGPGGSRHQGEQGGGNVPYNKQGNDKDIFE